MHHRLHEEYRLVDRDLDKKGPFKGIPLTVDMLGEQTDGLLDPARVSMRTLSMSRISDTTTRLTIGSRSLRGSTNT